MSVTVFENKSAALRKQSSSGGVFSFLAEKVLSHGGVVFGAAFNNNWGVEHICVDNLKELARLRKSKYVDSDMNDCYARTEEMLKSGREVLFTGVPCQVAALRTRLHKDYNNLLTAEVICHGAPRREAWQKYLTEVATSCGKTLSNISSIDFRDKTDGWEAYRFTVRFNDGDCYTEPARDNLYMKLFIGNMILKRGCFACPFKHRNTKADLTIGDLWGMSALLPERDRRLGTSLVIANTEKGAQAIDGMQPIATFSIAEVAKYNPSLISKAMKPEEYDTFNKRLDNGGLIIKEGNRIYNPSLLVRALRKIKRIYHRNGR